ncbi:uncharacterized protein LOC141680883 [Apium graveolens]|uniref:uncharacterized protein LOC141680883 n=1 Tax=Apium graveolens TaxID=4045 RepID=UPI003D7960CB
MLIFLEAIDDAYGDIIKTGPPYPMETVAMTPDVPEHYIRKEKSKCSDPEKASMLKDTKVRNFLHNSLDNMMSNKVIACKTVKDIWDALEIQCQEYDREDSNTKFLRALSEDWDAQTSIIRHQYDLNLLTLDEIYGMLKTHDLEIQQSRKMKVVALNVETHKGKEKMSERSRRRNIVEESNTDDLSDPDTDTDKDSEIKFDDPQVVEMAAMLVKGFRNMRFTKAQRKGGFNRKYSGDGKGKFRKNEGQYTKGRKFDKTKVTCYNCNERGHLTTECPKSTGKALVTTNSNKEWMESLGTNTVDECYALMTTHGEDASGTDKVPSVVFPIDPNNLSKLKTFLYSLHVTFKSKTIEYDSLIAENKKLRERNDFLESELICMNENEKAY